MTLQGYFEFLASHVVGATLTVAIAATVVVAAVHMMPLTHK